MSMSTGDELVSLIEQQRNYRASAQTFKILDRCEPGEHALELIPSARSSEHFKFH